MASENTTSPAATITSLPFEVLDLILSYAAELNAKESITYTYGLTEAPQPLQHVSLERYVRGRKPEDSLRWVAVDSIRQVSSTWRQWALGYAVKELYIRRWRGSERYALITIYFGSRRSFTNSLLSDGSNPAIFLPLKVSLLGKPSTASHTTLSRKQPSASPSVQTLRHTSVACGSTVSTLQRQTRTSSRS